MEALKNLSIAIRARDLKAVKKIVRDHPHLLQFEVEYEWPIMHQCIASDCADKDILKLYLAHGGDCKRKTNSGVSLLFLASAHSGNEAIANLLYAEGARLTPFEQAVLVLFSPHEEENVTAEVLRLLDEHPAILHERGDKGYT